MVVTVKGENDVDVKYEFVQPPRGWTAMSMKIRQKFALAKLKWSVDIRIDAGGEDRLVIFDVTTPTTIKEAAAATKQMVDAEMGNASMIYGAVFTITVK